MSNAFAIASVTATIQGVISRAGITVTAQSPDKVAQGAGGGNRVNVFLFHALPNAAWRNAHIPGQVRSGELGHPPLALDLHYLLTAYGSDDDSGDLTAQQVLGEAMRVLHDRAELTRQEIRNFARGPLADTGLDQQIETIRITHDPLSHEDLFRMWSTFSTPYRVSAVYQASVVLIDSQRPTKAPLPVLRRGKEGHGVLTRLDTDPTLARIEYREALDIPGFPAARVGDRVMLIGTDLPASGVQVIVRDSRREQSSDQPDGDIVAELSGANVTRVSATELLVALADEAEAGRTNDWTSGMLALELRFPIAGEDGAADGPSQRTTNAVPLAIAPRLRMQRDDDPNSKVLFRRTNANDKTFVNLTTEEPIEKSRRVFLILTEALPEADDPASAPAKPRFYQLPQDRDADEFSPRFDISSVESALYWVRLRVDGVDSLMFQRVPPKVPPAPAGGGPGAASGLPKPESLMDFDQRFQIRL